jgi:hypothetical protein
MNILSIENITSSNIEQLLILRTNLYILILYIL